MMGVEEERVLAQQAGRRKAIEDIARWLEKQTDQVDDWDSAKKFGMRLVRTLREHPGEVLDFQPPLGGEHLAK